MQQQQSVSALGEEVMDEELITLLAQVQAVDPQSQRSLLTRV